MVKQQHSQRSEIFWGHESMSKKFESFDSPFVLHSSDHLGLSIVAYKLDGANYNSWYKAIRISLDAKNKLSFIDGSLLRPCESDYSFKITSICNSMVKSWILNVMDKKIYDSILYEKILGFTTRGEPFLFTPFFLTNHNLSTKINKIKI